MESKSISNPSKSSDNTLAPASSSTDNAEDNCRLWIGNLDPKVTEYAMLKLIQRFNYKMRSFDFIYHRSGPDKGKPRGYCFVTLETPADAARLLMQLNGKLALSRRLAVKYAEVEKRDRPADLPSPTETSSSVADINVDVKIQAIEAKLKMMEENKDDSAPPVILYPPPANLKRQQEQEAEAAHQSGRRNRSEFHYRRPSHRNQPYRSRRR